jgi:hypothetical protein
MKSALILSMYCVVILLGNNLQAQSFMAPHPPNYAIVSTPGATLAQVVDTMYAHANLNDTGEGGAMEQLCGT